MGIFDFGKKKVDPLTRISAAAGLVIDTVQGYQRRKVSLKILKSECKTALAEIRTALDEL
jgi:hypothetical protein